MINRLEYNIKILNRLQFLLYTFSDWRFTQLLSNLGLDKDRFYEEPDKTLETIDKWINEHNLVIYE